jgi:purine-nucleoside phosphorylase
MKDLKKHIEEAVADVRKVTDSTPKIGIILGSGLGGLADKMDIKDTVGYENISHFPLSTVEGHAGRLLFGQLSGKDVVAMQGRFHFYEGYTMKQVTFPIRVLKALGIEVLIVSNACGGLNPQFKAGDLMIITDHINMQPSNPLIGWNDPDLGDRFPDMSEPYNKKLIQLAEECAVELKLKVQRGVYVSVPGPNLETAAEYRFLRTIGADVVGMSTVPEVIVAVHQKTRVLGLSIVTDMGLPDALKATSHQEILKNAGIAEPKLTAIAEAVVGKL